MKAERTFFNTENWGKSWLGWGIYDCEDN